MVDAAGKGTRSTLNAEAIAEIKGIRTVRSVVGWSQAGLLPEGAAASRLPDVVWATSQIHAVDPPIVKFQGSVRPLRPGEILLPSVGANGKSLLDLVGQHVTFTYQRRVKADNVDGVPVTLTVVGAFDATAPNNDGPQVAYVAHSDAESWEQAMAGVDAATFHRDGYGKLYVEATGRDAVGPTHTTLVSMGFSVTSEADVVSFVDPITANLQTLRTALAVVVGIAAAVLGALIGSSMVRQRGPQIAVAKAFGRRASVILASLAAESLMMGFVLAVGMVVAAAVATGVLALLTSMGGVPAMLAVRSVDVGEVVSRGGWLPVIVMVGLVLGSLPGALKAVWSNRPYDLLRSR
ncbi:ABC transporter permease [Acidipropionibacterium timonense]|uniref:ABC transporter permease n=1 Tax=Acidipropionibacterium timonense TaxID=2161818 RepID=UPI00102F72C6|nr:ABC transporter permease [Acidipropionibacterium timonense]